MYDDQLIQLIDIILLTDFLHLEVIANLAEYRTPTGFYNRKYLRKSANSTRSVIWWQGLCTARLRDFVQYSDGTSKQNIEVLHRCQHRKKLLMSIKYRLNNIDDNIDVSRKTLFHFKIINIKNKTLFSRYKITKSKILKKKTFI